MKKFFKFFMAAAIVAAGFTACSDEEVTPGPGPGPNDGPDTYSSLTVRDANSRPASYGTTDQDTPTSDEGLKLAASLKGFIFNGDITAAPTPLEFVSSSGDTEIKFTGPTDDKYNSNKFKLSSGDKYIYVLADQKGQSPSIAQQSSRVAYEIQKINAGFEDSTEEVAETAAPNGSGIKRVKPLPANIATNEKFVIGTLWGKTTRIAAGGTENNPTEVEGLEIGRLASKINLTEVKPGTETPLGGSFSDYSYRICSVPDALYLVGQWDGTNEPGKNASVGLVKSIYHDESFGSIGDQNTKFKNYQWTGAYPLNQPYYTVENTTSIQNGDQFYGNSTYIQLKTKYTPKSGSSLYKADGTTDQSVSLTNNGSFWLYTVYGEPRIFAENPHDTISGISLTGTYYDKGFMYYSFPVADVSESDPVKRHTVLRNHSYHVAVTEIKNFGSGSDAEVTPETPISSETWVTLEVSVLPWSKISQPVPL